MTRGALAVVQAGPRTLIVDRGRPGYEHLGMPRGGAADRELHAAALLLAGAGPDAATLECTAAGPTLECREAPVRVAVAGDCVVRHTEPGGQARELRAWRSHTLRPGDRVRVGPMRGALRAYVGVGGGVDVAPQLGSRSVSLRGGLSGLLGRPLQVGDVLGAGEEWREREEAEVRALAGLVAEGSLRVCSGPHAERVEGSAEALSGRSWRVSPSSDRTGIRLEGGALRLREGADVRSLGCPPGAIQVSGDGLPIVLGCDRGTTGGYALVAAVVGADLARLGRLRPGEEVRFEVVDVDTAVRLRRERVELLEALGLRE